MTALPADVARALQGVSRCPGCDCIHRWGPGKLCNDCITARANGAKLQRKPPVLKPRGLGEY